MLLTTGSGDFQNKLFGEAQGMPYKRVRFDMPDNDFADVDMLTPEQLNAPPEALAEHQVSYICICTIKICMCFCKHCMYCSADGYACCYDM
jgi:hypothetical protein